DRMLLPISATHFDARFFPEPGRFDIDRFSAPRDEHKQAAVFAPFGLGLRDGLGEAMGELQTMMMIAILMRNFRVELDSPGYEMRVVAAPLRRPDHGFRVQLRRR